MFVIEIKGAKYIASDKLWGKIYDIAEDFPSESIESYKCGKAKIIIFRVLKILQNLQNLVFFKKTT